MPYIYLQISGKKSRIHGHPLPGCYGVGSKTREIDDFYCTAIFIDPKDKPSEENELRLDKMIKKLKEND